MKTIVNKEKILREAVSIILIKYSMPTRQAAISEIINLFRGQLIINGNIVHIDGEDFEKVMRYQWHISTGYAYTQIDGKKISLHRFLLKVPEDMHVDHIDGNPLNNKKTNLRFANRSQNMMNTKKYKNNKSGHKGVYWNNQMKKWQAKINVNKKSIYLGSFESIERAVKAYNNAALVYHREYGRINDL